MSSNKYEILGKYKSNYLSDTLDDKLLNQHEDYPEKKQTTKSQSEYKPPQLN